MVVDKHRELKPTGGVCGLNTASNMADYVMVTQISANTKQFATFFSLTSPIVRFDTLIGLY